MEPTVGGYSETIPIEEIQKICDQVKPKVEEKTKKVYKEFRAVAYKYQMEHGDKYLIKVCVGNNYLHLCVFKLFSEYEYVLKGVEEGHSKDHPLKPSLCLSTAQ